MYDKFDTYLFNIILNLISQLSNKQANCNNIAKVMNNMPGVFDYYLNLNSGRKKGKQFNRIIIDRAIKRKGYAGINQLKDIVYSKDKVINHKVAKIQALYKKEDVYCMTVQKYHNFALETHNGNIRDGFFVSNTNITQDYFFVARGDSGTSIQTLPGLQYETTQTLLYFRTRVLGALRIPLSFLGYDQNSSSRANLASQVLMFAKAIQSVQRIVVKQLQKIAVIHLYSQGYRNEDILNFELQLTNPSVIYEQEKISLWQSKINLAANVKDLQLLSTD